MKILISAILCLASSYAFAGYTCWEGPKIGQYSVFVDTKNSSYGVSATASCDDEMNCDAPIINYQLGGGSVSLENLGAGVFVASDAKNGPKLFSLTLNTQEQSENSRGDDKTCAKQSCFSGLVSGATSIKPGKAMEARLKAGIKLTCVRSK
jgi:hypothetical protein